MKTSKRIFLLVFLVVLFVLEANALVAQERYSTLTGIVRGIHVHGLRRWLEVENEKDKAVVNFRIGHKTVYIPHRYLNAGERVKVEYLMNRGVPVAYTVTILESQKEGPKATPKESPKGSPKESPK
jgi:hypothetical protein